MSIQTNHSALEDGPTMNETEILRSQLMRRLREAVDATVDIDGGAEQPVEVAATALTDMLAEVLVKLPAAGHQDGASVIGMAMANRVVRRMAAELLISGTIDFSEAKVAAANAGVRGELADG